MSDKQDWTVLEIIEWTAKFFKNKNIQEPRLEAEVLLAKVLNMKRLDLYLNFERLLDDDERIAIRTMINKRIDGMPTAYLIGEKEFMSLKFKVNENVLIPRPETELLVEHVLKFIDENSADNLNIVDICTGSGNIPISLVKYNNKINRVYAVDINKKSLYSAQENAFLNNVSEKIEFLFGDLFSPLHNYPIKNSIDIITSNPPYIKTSEMKNLQKEVQFEPALALDGGENGDMYYEPLIKDAKIFLKDNGMLIVEIGSDLKDIVERMFNKYDYKNVTVIKDYSKLDRFVVGMK